MLGIVVHDPLAQQLSQLPGMETTAPHGLLRFTRDGSVAVRAPSHR